MNKALGALVGAARGLLVEIWSGYALPAGLLALASSWLLSIVLPNFYYYFIPEGDAQSVLAIVFILFLMGFWYLLLSIVQGARKSEHPMVTISFTKVFTMVFVLYLAASYQAMVEQVSDGSLTEVNVFDNADLSSGVGAGRPTCSTN